MEGSILEIVGKIAGLAGLSLGVFLLLFREFIRKKIFGNVNQEQTYSLMRLFLILTFSLALLGIIAWILPSMINNKDGLTQNSNLRIDDDFKRIYYESFDVKDSLKELKRFEGIWQIGVKGDWDGSLINGFYRLNNFGSIENASFTNTLSYYDENDNNLDLGESKVSVKVRLNPPFATYSSAGLKFRGISKGSSYYSFSLNAGGTVSLMHKNNNSMKVLWSGEIDKNNQEFTQLKIIGENNKLDLYINDKLVHVEENIAGITGNPGIFAYSTGAFDFDDFNVFIRTQ